MVSIADCLKAGQRRTTLLVVALGMFSVLLGFHASSRQLQLLRPPNTETTRQFRTDTLPTTHPERASLRRIYTQFIDTQVHFNNWNLGCNDLQFLAPYLRAINDRLHWGMTRVRRTIIDVGANAGDDANAILGSFQAVRGMCWRFGNPIRLLSIEPSPKVFCDMKEALQLQPNETEYEEIQLLNIALSDQTGNLLFMDPGNEGGKLVGNEVSPFEKMTQQEFDQATTCSLSDHKNMSVDYKRQTVVPTYTLDLLVESFESLGKHLDRIFVLKVDTEGHDDRVLKGAAQLLQQKRIDFVLFETSRNHLLKSTVEFMSSKDYECYLIAPNMLVPLHLQDWWYPHLDNFTGFWWGNALCGIGASPEMAMLWRMYHSDNLQLVNAYEVLYERNRTLVQE